MAEYILITLIFIFYILLSTQLYQYTFAVQEGLTSSGDSELTFQKYSGDDETDATTLATKNKSNIQYIVQKLSNLEHLKGFITDLSGNVSDLDGQVKSLVQSQKDYATQSTPSDPPTVSGS